MALLRSPMKPRTRARKNGKPVPERSDRIMFSGPMDDNLALAGEIRNLFFRARQERRPLVAQWNRNYRILRNRTWGSGRASWLPSPEIPEIYPIVAAQVGWMTDQRPSFEFIPAAEPHSPHHQFYQQLADDLQTTIDTIWHVHKFEAEVEKVLWDGFTFGTGIFKNGWDPSLDGGLGNAILRRIDPYTFYPDPQGKTAEDCNYFIEARTMSLQEADRRWPGAGEKLAEGLIEDIDKSPTINDTGGSTPMANPGAISPSTTARYGAAGGTNRIHATEDPGVTVLEAWLRSHETTYDEHGDMHVDEQWRVVVVAGNHILMDEDAKDLYAHGRHPYVRYVPHETGEFWGQSMVEMLTPSQLAVNRLLASLQHNIELTGNPIFKESARAGLSRTKITNKPGQRVLVNDAQQADWLMPPPLQSGMFQLIEFYINEMERVSGLTAIARGLASGGRPAEGVIDSMQEASFVRVRMALRNLEWALRECAEIVASLVTENYTTPRMVAITGPSSERSSLGLLGKHFYVPTESGRVPMKFQILCNGGSSLATSRNARIAEADTLFALGAIDKQAVLEAHNYPNQATILKRVMEAEANGTFNPPGARQRARK